MVHLTHDGNTHVSWEVCMYLHSYTLTHNLPSTHKELYGPRWTIWPMQDQTRTGNSRKGWPMVATSTHRHCADYFCTHRGPPFTHGWLNTAVCSISCWNTNKNDHKEKKKGINYQGQKISIKFWSREWLGTWTVTTWGQRKLLESSLVEASWHCPKH